MNKKAFSPYIRAAMLSTIKAPFVINERIIFDYEVILVAGGRCKITIDDTAYLCEKNDVVLIRPGVRHKFECVENRDFVQPHIHFDVIYSGKSEETPISFKPWEAMDEDELSLIQEDVFETVQIPYVFTPYDMERFKKIFYEIITLFTKKPHNYELLYKARLLELIDCILTQFESGRAGGGATHDYIVAVKNYIDNNYLSVITLDALSGQFYRNKYTLLRKFRSVYRQNIISYYRTLRMAYAKNALETTDISIHSIAERMNFSDIYSFSRFFKTYAGCSPTAYRKSLGDVCDK